MVRFSWSPNALLKLIPRIGRVGYTALQEVELLVLFAPGGALRVQPDGHHSLRVEGRDVRGRKPQDLGEGSGTPAVEGRTSKGKSPALSARAVAGGDYHVAPSSWSHSRRSVAPGIA